MSRPGRANMLDNLADSITPEELDYLLDEIRQRFRSAASASQPKPGARFTREEVTAMQFARRMVLKAYANIPDEEQPITVGFYDGQLRHINAALTKMEDACDGE